MTEVGTEAAPVVETTEAPSKVDDVARAVLDRKSKRDSKRTAPTEETREFWETWADDKATRPAPVAAATDGETESTDDEGDAEAAPSRSKSSRSSSDKGRSGRDSKDRGGRGSSRAKSDTKLEKPKAEKAEKAEEGRSTRSKRDTVATPAPAMDAAQARLFVSLGKKHGISADDLRDLLAGAIGGDKARIGSVSLRDSHAHVRVPEDLVEKIIKGVNGTQHNEHDVTVERARA